MANPFVLRDIDQISQAELLAYSGLYEALRDTAEGALIDLPAEERLQRYINGVEVVQQIAQSIGHNVLVLAHGESPADADLRNFGHNVVRRGLRSGVRIRISYPGEERIDG